MLLIKQKLFFLPSRFIYDASTAKPEGGGVEKTAESNAKEAAATAERLMNERINVIEQDIKDGNAGSIKSEIDTAISDVNTIAQNAFLNVTATSPEAKTVLAVQQEYINNARLKAVAKINANWIDYGVIGNFVSEKARFLTILTGTADYAKQMKDANIDANKPETAINNISSLRDASKKLLDRKAEFEKVNVKLNTPRKWLTDERSEMMQKFDNQSKEFSDLADTMSNQVEGKIVNQRKSDIENSKHVKKIAEALVAYNRSPEDFAKNSDYADLAVDIVGVDLLIAVIQSEIQKYPQLTGLAGKFAGELSGLESLKIEATRLLPDNQQLRSGIINTINGKDKLADSMLDKMGSTNPTLPPYGAYTELLGFLDLLKTTQNDCNNNPILADMILDVQNKIDAVNNILGLYRQFFDTNLSSTNKELVSIARKKLTVTADALATAEKKYGKQSAEYTNADAEYKKALKSLNGYYQIGAEGIMRMATLVRPSDQPPAEIAAGEVPTEGKKT